MTKQLAIAELDKQVASLLQEVLDRREPVLTRLPGILGLNNTTGSAEVSGKPGWVYVRIGNDETLATAFNNRTSNRNGLPVIVGYDPAQPTLFQVLSERQPYEGEWAGGGAMGNHHLQHEYGNPSGGDDIVWIRMRQLTDFLVYPTDPESLTVNIADGVYFIGSTAYKYDGGTLDLTSSVPSSGQRWVLIALSDSGVYSVESAASSTLSYSDIPDATDPTHFKLAAVLLAVGDTAITDWPNSVRIVDLRLAGSRSVSGSGGYVDFANCIVVATSGGNYDNIQDGVDNGDADSHVLVLNGSWAENVTFTSDQVNVSGLVDAHHSGPYGCYVVGADDTGPILDLDASGIWGNMVVNRALSGGSGAYIAVDASDTTYYYQLTDFRIHIDGAATGRAVTCLKIVGRTSDSKESTVSRCVIKLDNGGTGPAVEAAGGVVFIEQSWVENSTASQDAVLATAACTVELRDCHIIGDLTGTAGATLKLENCYVDGAISGWDAVLGNFQLATGTDDNYYSLPLESNRPAYHRVMPAGTVSGLNRSTFQTFFTDFVADPTNYEAFELVAFDDGADIFGCVRTTAGGTGALRELRLGVGTTKANYVQIDSSGNVILPDGVYIQVDIVGEATADAGVTIDGVLLKDNGVSVPGTLLVDTINEYTGSAGVTIEGVLLEDSTVTIPDYLGVNGPVGTASFPVDIITGSGAGMRLRAAASGSGHTFIELEESSTSPLGMRIYWDTTDDTVKFQANAGGYTDVIYFDVLNDYVGIGGTPSYPFHVTTSTGVVVNVESTGTNSISSVRIENDAQVFALQVRGDTSDIFTIRDTSNSINVVIVEPGSPANSIYVNSTGVGIGTNSPGGLLDLEGDSPYIYVNSTNANPYVALIWQDGGSNRWLLDYGTGTTDDLRFYSYGTSSTVLYLDYSNGYVAVGKSDPSYMLDVYESYGGTTGTYSLSVVSYWTPSSAPGTDYPAAAVITGYVNSAYTIGGFGCGARIQAVSNGSVGNSVFVIDVLGYNQDTGTVPNFRGVWVRNFQNTGGGSVTNAYGVYVSDQTAATNNYGVYVGQTTDWAIYCGGAADNYMAGSLGIGDSTPSYKLEVNSGTTDIVASLKSTDNYAFLAFHDSITTTDYVKIGVYNTDFQIYTNNTLRLSITNSGGLVHPVSYSTTVGATNRDLYVDNVGLFGYVSSSIEFKQDVEALTLQEARLLLQLEPVAFRYKANPEEPQLGFIAEWEAERAPGFVSFSGEGKPETVEKTRMIPALVKMIQDYEERISRLEADLNELKKSQVH